MIKQGDGNVPRGSVEKMNGADGRRWRMDGGQLVNQEV